MHKVHAGNGAETRTLNAMLATVLKRFAVERVIVVADRGLLSLDNVAELAAVAEQTQRQLQFILAVPARRYGELGGTLEAMRFVDGQAEATFAEQRLVVAHDPQRATEQSAKRRARIHALEDFTQTQVHHLHAPDTGPPPTTPTHTAS